MIEKLVALGADVNCVLCHDYKKGYKEVCQIALEYGARLLTRRMFRPYGTKECKVRIGGDLSFEEKLVLFTISEVAQLSTKHRVYHACRKEVVDILRDLIEKEKKNSEGYLFKRFPQAVLEGCSWSNMHVIEFRFW